MQVTFTRVGGRRYVVSIERDHGPPLVPRYAPGYDDLMPHDLAHYLVEEHYGIELGVWGQLAAGGSGIFTPAPEDADLGNTRRGQRIAAVGHADMIRSEQLVVVTVAAWSGPWAEPGTRTSWSASTSTRSTFAGPWPGWARSPVSGGPCLPAAASPSPGRRD